tara:strand:+ start:827 stop:1219 length:393 start_codon:yes stop_codon:yes gene_type:complete
MSIICKIYKIVDNTNGNVYIGSTKTKFFQNRMKVHRYYVNKKEGGSSSIVMKNNDYYVEIIEECDISIRYERERYYINNTDKCINERKLNGYDKTYISKRKKKEYDFMSSWGGDKRAHNNLLTIDVDLFI